MSKILKQRLYSLLRFFVKPFYGTGIGNYWPFNLVHKLYQKVSIQSNVITKTKYNFKMKLVTGLLIDDTIIYKGVWEPGITKVIVNNLHLGDTFLDIGANIGYYSLLASQFVGSKGKIISFEPNMINYQRFVENININEYQNIEIKKIGVGNVNSKLELFYDEKNPGATSLVKGKNHTEINKEIVDIVRLDDILGDMKVDLIKMDIEGFEYEAILGMINILKNNKKLKMIFELSPYIYQRKENDYIRYSINILDTLSSLGFEMWHIATNGNLKRITNNEKYVHQINGNSHGQSDIYCVKNT